MSHLEECITIPGNPQFSTAPEKISQSLFLQNEWVADGRYQVLEQISTRRSFTDVFRAADWESGGQVALKVFHEPDITAKMYVDREIAAHASLSGNPGILEVIDFGVLDTLYGERRYLATLAEDGNFFEQIRHTHDRIDATIHMGRSIFSALQIVHDNGLVHLDVKPENILVDEVQGHVLADFGIVDTIEDYDTAHAANPAVRGIGSMAISHTTVRGPVGFYAPERVHSHAARPESDTFPMGVTMYVGVTGKLPFDLGKPCDSTPEYRAELYEHKITNESPVPPSEIVRRIPGELDKFIMACLENQPENRPTDAESIAVLSSL